MLLNFLGRGSAFNANENNTSAYILNNNHLLLIDCGETVFRQLMSDNLLNKVDRVDILITHTHSDHIGSLSSLIFYLHYIKNIKPTIYFRRHKVGTISRILECNGNLDSQYSIVPFDCDELIIIDKFSIIPKNIYHVVELTSVAYIIKYNNKTIYYSGDTYEVPNKMILEECDEIYQDTCIADYDGNIHCSIYKLDKEIEYCYRSKIYCMNYDNSNELINLIRYYGFNWI